MKRFRPFGAAAISFAFCSAPALAQVTPGMTVQPMSPDADALANDMRVLGTNPNDVRVLVDAGERALRLGDDTAAGGLFTRVEKIDPNNARMKAGVGTILLHNERPGEALRYYALAERGGADLTAFASDRGLAYDLVGDQARAQREYRRALARSNDAETTKRFALSLGISGQRDAAVKLLDPLLRSGDRSAWRAQAFVLAMANDLKGAQKIADTMLPGAMAGGLKPFFLRLPALPPVDRAFAVNFGEVRPSPTRLADARLAPQLPALAAEPVIPVTALAANNVAIRAVQGESRADRRRRERAEREARAQALAAPVQRPVQVASAVLPRSVVPIGTTIPAVNARPGFTTIEPLPAARTIVPAQTRQSAAPTVLPANRPSTVPTVLPQTARLAGVVTGAPPTVVANAIETIRPPRVVRTLGTPIVGSTASSSGVQVASLGQISPAGTAPAASATSTLVVAGPLASSTSATTAPLQTASIVAPPPTVSAAPIVATEGKPAPSETAARANATVNAHAVPTIISPVAKPVEVARATVKPPKPPRASKRESEDSILARIIAGISVPGSELDVAPASTKQSSKTVEVASLEPAATKRRGAKASETTTTDDADQALPSKAKKKSDATSDRTSDKRGAATKGKKAASPDISDTSDDDAKATKSSRKKSGDKAADTKTASKKDDDKASASRIFVQVAGGAHEGDLAKAWDATKKKAPELFRGKQGYTTPLRATNRVLAGPFKSEDEAQAFINKLSAKGLSGFVFTSDKGQKVDKLPAKSGK